jgi:hypothetical protein
VKWHITTIERFVLNVTDPVRNAKSNIPWKNLAPNAMDLANPVPTNTSMILKARKNATGYARNAKHVRFVEKKSIARKSTAHLVFPAMYVKRRISDILIFVTSAHRLLHVPIAWRAILHIRIGAQKAERKLAKFPIQPYGLSAASRKVPETK